MRLNQGGNDADHWFFSRYSQSSALNVCYLLCTLILYSFKCVNAEKLTSSVGQCFSKWSLGTKKGPSGPERNDCFDLKFHCSSYSTGGYIILHQVMSSGKACL